MAAVGGPFDYSAAREELDVLHRELAKVGKGPAFEKKAKKGERRAAAPPRPGTKATVCLRPLIHAEEVRFPLIHGNLPNKRHNGTILR